MDNRSIPRRKSKKARYIILGAAGVVLALIVSLLIWKRETVWFVFHSDAITPRDAGQAVERIRAGDVVIVEDSAGRLAYLALDGSMIIDMRYSGDEITSLSADFNMYSIPMGSVSEAVDSGMEILSPYFGQPELEALAFLLVGEILAYVSGDTINYARALGGYNLRVTGNTTQGGIYIEMAKAGAG